jgi:hypothetical protein
MKIKTIILWSLINSRRHPKLDKNDLRTDNLKSLALALFPGATWTEFGSTLTQLLSVAQTVLWEQYKRLKSADPHSINPNEEIEIAPFLPSNGLEWTTRRWHITLWALLTTP